MLTLLGDTFPGQNDADTMACLKRAVILVFGKHAVYLRFPSQAADAVVHRITRDDLHRDLLGPHDKYLYADYKRGSTTTGPDFEESVRQEQAMIHKNFLKMESYGHAETYVASCNRELQNHLRPRRPPPLRHLPSSSSSAESEVPATIPFSVRLASPDAPRKRLLNSSSFVYDSTPKRRLTKKTFMPAASTEEIEDADVPSHASSSHLSSAAPAADVPAADGTEEGDEMDIEEEDPDEAATKDMFG